MTYIKPNHRWIRPLMANSTSAAATPTAGRVYLQLVEVAADCKVDAIVLMNSTTVAGNVTAGIYGAIPTEETCNAAVVLVQSANTALSGTSVPQVITFTETNLRKGRYYIALEFSDATNTFVRWGNIAFVDGWSQQYDRAGGYGALTDPCPAVSNTGSNMPCCSLRVTK